MSRLGTILCDRLSLIDEGGAVVSTEYGAAARYVRDDLVFERFDGAERRTPRAHTLEIDTADGAFLDFAEAARLRSGTLRVFAQGRDRHTLWNAPAVPSVLPLQGETGGPALKRLRLFTGEGAAPIADGVANLLSVYGWRGLTALPAAYNLAAPPDTESLEPTGVLTLALDAAGSAAVSADVLCPCPGATARASLVLSNVTLFAPGDTAVLSAVALGPAGAPLAFASVSLLDAAEVALVLPFATVSVRWHVALTATTGDGASLSLSTPTIRLGDTSAPVYY